MSTFKITIPFDPKPKASIRLGQKKMYMPSTQGMIRIRQFVHQYLSQAEILKPPLMKGPLFVIVHFRMKIAAQRLKGKDQLRNCQPHARRPDADNLEKFVNDSLNGLLWEDDARIAWILRSKTWTTSRTGNTTIFVRELGYGAPNYQQIIDDIKEHIVVDGEDPIDELPGEEFESSSV